MFVHSGPAPCGPVQGYTARPAEPFTMTRRAARKMALASIAHKRQLPFPAFESAIHAGDLAKALIDKKLG